MCVVANGIGNVVLLIVLLVLSLSLSLFLILAPIFRAVQSLMGQVNTIFVDTQHIKLVLFNRQQQQQQRYRRHWQWEWVKEMELRLSRLTAYHFLIAISSVRFDSLAEPSAMFYQSLTQLFCVQINRLN